jgi:hypothetical protein
VVKKIFGPRRENLTKDRRKLYNEELHNFFFSTNVV